MTHYLDKKKPNISRCFQFDKDLFFRRLEGSKIVLTIQPLTTQGRSGQSVED